MHTFFIIFLSLLLIFLIGFVLIYILRTAIPKRILNHMVSMVIQDSNDSILLYDANGKFLYANRLAYSRIRESGKEPTVSYFEQWFLERGQQYPVNTASDAFLTISGQEYHYKLDRKELFNRHHIFIGTFFHIHDVTEEFEKIKKERYLATHDPLTHLYNKEMFFEQAQAVLEKYRDTEYLMLSSDIQNFKLINDLFGADRGDSILLQIADTLRSFCNTGNVYGRIGNDRFGLLMPKANFREQFFIDEIARAVYVENHMHYPIKIHIGVYEITDRTIPVSVMYDRALMALLNIKQDYQKIIAYYDDNLRNNFLQEQEIMGQFETALHEGQFQLYLQPQVYAHSGEIHGAEVLVRWIHPEKGMISPGVFINIFEKNGIIVELDQYVWEQSCRLLKKWKDNGRDDLYLSVNISPRDFYYIDVYETILGLTRRYDISPQNLHLEITETSVMTDVLQRIALITKLQKAGFLVEMDDFGSGYSSLNTLKDIPIDVMKIDMAFLQKTTDRNRSEKILSSIIRLAKDLKIPTIVEGVETEDQVAFLKNIHCDIFQGYYFAKPMPVNQFESSLLLS